MSYINQKAVEPVTKICIFCIGSYFVTSRLIKNIFVYNKTIIYSILPPLPPLSLILSIRS